MAETPNIFARLHKWATRQDENFLTESLAVVLEQLLILSPEVGTRLIGRLTGGFIGVPSAEASLIEIRTQVETGQGRPDLEFSVPHKLSWIEVKAESALRVGQLEGYRVLLAESGAASTQLVLLTRYAEQFSPGDTQPDLAIRWYEFAGWLEDELPALEEAGAVAQFVGRQFLEFLRTRKMTLTQVEKFMPEGVRALNNLLNMLFEAARACKIPVKKSAGWDYIGLTLDGNKYWVGIFFAEPEKLWFTTYSRLDPVAATRLGVGELREENTAPGRYRWWLGAELDSEGAHFYSRTKVGQMEWLEKFIRDGLVKARSIETPDQPPIPDQSEGN